MKPLRDRWQAFMNIALDPWSLFLLISTVSLSAALIRQTNQTIVAILTLFVSISSAILGGIWAKRWDDINGEQILVARGRGAIRSLKLLLGSTAALESRVRLYLFRYIKVTKKSKNASDATTLYLEEVIERCNLLEEEVLSSIENWMDIIPEANVKTQIGLISELKSRVESLSKEIKSLNTELNKSKGKSEKEIEQLKIDKAQKEKELGNLRQELLGKSIGISSSLLPSGTAEFGRSLQFGLSAISPLSGSVLHFQGSEEPKFSIDTGGVFVSTGSDTSIIPGSSISIANQKKKR